MTAAKTKDATFPSRERARTISPGRMFRIVRSSAFSVRLTLRVVPSVEPYSYGFINIVSVIRFPTVVIRYLILHVLLYYS